MNLWNKFQICIKLLDFLLYCTYLYIIAHAYFGCNIFLNKYANQFAIFLFKTTEPFSDYDFIKINIILCLPEQYPHYPIQRLQFKQVLNFYASVSVCLNLCLGIKVVNMDILTDTY